MSFTMFCYVLMLELLNSSHKQAKERVLQIFVVLFDSKVVTYMCHTNMMISVKLSKVNTSGKKQASQIQSQLTKELWFGDFKNNKE